MKMSAAEMKKADVVVDVNYMLEYIDRKYKKEWANICPRWPKNNEYTYENDFDYYLFERLNEVLNIENSIKELRNKNANNNEKIKTLDEIKNNFHNIMEESLKTKNYSNQLLKSLNENYQKNKEIKFAKETYEKVCLGVIENAVKSYNSFKNKIIFIYDEIKSFN